MPHPQIKYRQIASESQTDFLARVKTTPYRQLSYILRCRNDYQLGIHSYFDEKNNQWVRDATLASEQYPSVITPVIQKNDALLRCLSRLQAVDFAIKKKLGVDSLVISKVIKAQFQMYSTLMLDSQTSIQRLNELEAVFSTLLLEKLYEVNLTAGCETKEDAEALLFHYRNLSSLLAPTPTMVTLSYDKEAGVLLRETNYPVTRKTAKQKEQLQELRHVNPYPLAEDKTAHTVANLAIQEADQLFAEYHMLDDRLLPAQTRKTHLVGVKNAFIVKQELIETNLPYGCNALTLQPKEGDTLWLGRMGVPVYVGKGESDIRIQEATKENLTQITMAKQALCPHLATTHLTCLNTTFLNLEQQQTMLTHLEEAFEDSHDSMSNVPVNLIGTTYPMSIHPKLFMDRTLHGRVPLQKATRFMDAAHVILQAAKNGLFSLLNCASGQDRTGVAVELTKRLWAEEIYKKNGWTNTKMHKMLSRGGNAAEIASFLVPGSAGIKTDSLAVNRIGGSDAFDLETTAYLFRASARTNKEPEVDNVAFLKVLQENSFAMKNYNNAKSRFRNVSDQRGLSIINTMELLEKTTLSPKAISDMTITLNVCYELHGCQELKEQKRLSNLLCGLSKELSGHQSSRWQKLGHALFGFAALCAVVACIGTAVFGFGSPLAIAGAIGAVVCLMASAGIHYFNQETGLAKAVSDYQSNSMNPVSK